MRQKRQNGWQSIMISSTSERGVRSGTRTQFPATRWSVVLTARDSDVPKAEAALAQLCELYWYPIYAFLRRKGHPQPEAQDLTQGFFGYLLQRPWLRSVDPEKGRFRTYLLRCLTRYVINDTERKLGPTRCPHARLVSLDAAEAEARYAGEAVDRATPDRLFERRWVAELIGHTKTRLAAEWNADGKGPLYRLLEPHLTDRAERGELAKMAQSLGQTEGAVRVALHRLRQRFGELLRETVAETLADPSQVDQEIRSLFRAWG